MSHSRKTQHKCKFCSFISGKWPELINHVMDEHAQEYIAIERWLSGRVDERLIQAKRLAREGMIGYNATK